MDAETAESIRRLQVAMWLPARCAVCGIEYRDVDDFIARDPRASGSTPWTPDPDTGFTDELCWEAPSE